MNQSEQPNIQRQLTTGHENTVSTDVTTIPRPVEQSLPRVPDTATEFLALVPEQTTPGQNKLGKKTIAAISALALGVVSFGAWMLRPQEGNSTDPNRPQPGVSGPAVPGPTGQEVSPSAAPTPEITPNPTLEKRPWLVNDPELALDKNPLNSGIEGLTVETFPYTVDGEQMSLGEFVRWTEIKVQDYSTPEKAQERLFEQMTSLPKSILDFKDSARNAAIWPTDKTDELGGDLGYGAGHFQSVVYWDTLTQRTFSEIPPAISGVGTGDEASLRGFMYHISGKYNTVATGQKDGSVQNKTPYEASFVVDESVTVGNKVTSSVHFIDNASKYPERFKYQNQKNQNEEKILQVTTTWLEYDGLWVLGGLTYSSETVK